MLRLSSFFFQTMAFLSSRTKEREDVSILEQEFQQMAVAQFSAHPGNFRWTAATAGTKRCHQGHSVRIYRLQERLARGQFPRGEPRLAS